MKIIASKAGQGKTGTILSMAGKLSDDGVNSLYISNEHTSRDIAPLVDYTGANVSHVQFEYAESFADAIKRVMSGIDSYEHFFVDISPTTEHERKYKTAALELMSQIEVLYNKKIYATLQVAYQAEINDLLAVYDYQKSRAGN